MKKIAFTLGFAFLASISMAQGWSESYVNNNTSLQIYWNQNGGAVQYGVIDLTSGYMRMNYGPGSGWATSIDVMPIYWSGGTLYQGYPVTEKHSLSGANLVVNLSGTSQTLTTNVKVTFYPPYVNHISALIQGSTTGTVALDNRPGEAFKPIFLSSMNDSSTSWDSQYAYAGTTVANYPNTSGGWIIPGPSSVTAKSWGVAGGTSQWKTNAPTVSITSATPYVIAGWLNQDSNANDDNVGFWASTTTVPTSWTFTATASSGPSGGQNWNAVDSTTGPDGKIRVIWAGTPFGTTANEMALWRMSPGGTPIGHAFGPFGSAWTPSFVTVTPDGKEHVLFKNLSGAIAIYTINPDFSFTAASYGPSANWTATGLSAEPNNDVNIEWTNTNGQIAIWDLTPTGNQSAGVYGSSNWTAYAFTTAASGVQHVIWQQASGELALYRVSSPAAPAGTTFSSLGAGWVPSFIAVDSNNYDRIFFSNLTTGQFQLWNLSPTNANTPNSYNAQPGWWPTALSIAPNNDPELMWVNNDGEMETWDINAGGTASVATYGPN